MEKTVWITGASSGIGREFARRYARLGFRLILTARRTDRLEALAAELTAKHSTFCRILPADLEQESECARLCEALTDERIDIFINNAGFGVSGAVEFTEADRVSEAEGWCGGSFARIGVDATLEEDAELLKIFERTYGPIKRDPLAAFRPVQKRERPDFAAEQWEIAPEYLLVDGYNIIFAWDELNALSKESLDAARHKLMDILCNYQGYQKCVLILVFDAYRVPGSPGAIEQYHNIHVVYTKEAETADMFIERVTHEIGKSRRVRVATSDGMEQVIILGHGALRVSARMFHEEVQNVEKQIRALVQGEA